MEPSKNLSETDELKALEWEMGRRREKERLAFFVPNGAQERFLRAFGLPESRLVIFSSANWVGKTAAAIVGLGACIWPEYAKHSCFSGDVYSRWLEYYRYPKRARIVSTTKEVEEIGSVQEEIKKWWPAGRYRADKAGKTYLSLYTTDTGWSVSNMTYNQELLEFEGGTVGLFIFNEPPPEDIFYACMGRMKYGGKVMMPMTPLAESAWIKDRLVDKTFGPSWQTKVVYADIEEACQEHGVNGVIPHSAIAQLLESCSPDEIEARAHGKFMHLANIILSGFRRDVHVSKEPVNPPPATSVEHIQVIDPHAGKPFAILWAYADPAGFIHIYDEWPPFDIETAKESQFTVSDYCALFRGMEKHRVTLRLLDRHFGNNRDLQTGKTLKEDFIDRGFFFTDTYSCSEEMETGILKIKEYLAYDASRPVDSLNRPKMLIDPKCKNLIRSIERWSRNPATGRPNDDTWKHFCDCLRYLCAYAPVPYASDSAPVTTSKRFLRRDFPMILEMPKRESWNTARPFDYD